MQTINNNYGWVFEGGGLYVTRDANMDAFNAHYSWFPLFVMLFLPVKDEICLSILIVMGKHLI